MTSEITTELLKPSGNTLKLEAEGDVIKIRISTLVKDQVKDFVSGELAFWDDGKPKMQWIFSGVSDGEESRYFMKDWGAQRRAFVEALRKANVQAGDDLSGGTLTVKWESTEAPTRPGLSGAKQYRMKFEPAPGAVVDEDLI